MAGRDASANLGGMLSQIGGAIGGMSGGGAGLMRPIMTSFRPQLDPNSVESLQRQAAFQGRIGDTEQARLFTGQALALEERNREEAEKQRKLAEGQARTKALNDYTQAIANKDPVAIKAAEAEAMRVGQLQGFNMMPLLAQAEQRLRSQQDAVFTDAERARVAKQRAENQAVDKATEALAAAFNRANTVEEMDALLESAGPLVAQQAQQLRNSGVARLDKNQQRELQEAERTSNLEIIDVSLLPDDDSALAKGLSKAVTTFNKEIEAFNKEVAGKKIVPNSRRQDLKDSRRALERRLALAADRAALRKDSEERDKIQDVETAALRILARDLPKDKVQDARSQTGFNFIIDTRDSYKAAEDFLKREMIRDLYKQNGLPVPEQYKEPEEDDNKPGGQAGRRAARSGVPTSTAAPTGSGTADDPINL